MSSEVALERLVELEAGNKEPFAADEAREQLGLAAAREVESSAYGLSRVARLLARSQLDEPGAVRFRRREPELDPFVAETGFERGRQRRRGVDDKQITLGQKPRQLAKTRVDELEVVPRRYEHRDVVATEPTRFRRFVRLLPNGARERAHAATPGSSRAR